MSNINKLCRLLPLATALLATTACQSDWRDGIATDSERTGDQTGILFSASVESSKGATRSDGSIVNKNETWLKATDDESHPFYVGVFGTYTGQDSWSNTSSPNLFYNQKMRVNEPEGRHNELTYSPLRFWPNTKLAGSDTKYERVSFWAYYPWNNTDDPGQYGIHVVADNMEGQGMGSLYYSMDKDASRHHDFMISDLVTDCSKDQYPLESEGVPGRVPLRFHHMLAQVRIYAFIRCTDKMVYETEMVDGETVIKRADADWLGTLADGTTEIRDEYNNLYTIVKSGGTITSITSEVTDGTLTTDEFTALNLGIPIEAECVRWVRSNDIWDVTHKRRRALIQYSMSFNNIHREALFTPHYQQDKAGNWETKFTYEDKGILDTAKVSHYVMNPYWFKFHPDTGKRYMLNENYMYGFFEDTPAWTLDGDDESGMDWNTFGPQNVMQYDLGDDNSNHEDTEKHYNYAPCNIIMAVPQVMDDNDVPSITLEGVSINEAGEIQKDANGKVIKGRVTVNMLNMNLKWESGFIYSYAFTEDDLQPGDDKVLGPANIIVAFDPEKYTDQW